MTPTLSVSPGAPRTVSTTFTIGVESSPYLADHGFHGMVVLPGASYVQMAAAIERQLVGAAPSVFRRLTFHTPIILPAHDIVIEVTATEDASDVVHYAFRETGAADPAATLDVERSDSMDSRQAEPPNDQAGPAMTAAELYSRIRGNGNEYGPQFQRIERVWKQGEEWCGVVADLPLTAHGDGRHPAFLDSAVQMLIPFALETGQTFILRSIDRIDLGRASASGQLRARATLTRRGASASEPWSGNVELVSSTGDVLLALSGVGFSLLDHRADAPRPTATALVVAANFTAEPLEDSLRFWERQFGAPLALSFAPYNQIFQELLQDGSAFRRNQDGINVILLSLDEWHRAGRPAVGVSVESASRAISAAGHTPHPLPNGLVIAHLNQYETQHVYKEIFQDECYLRHGVRLSDGATVIDIGANIGLFSLFVMNTCRDARVYAFEPAPTVYELLKTNVNAYGGGNVHAVNAGVSNTPGTAPFTFYEKSSVFSSFHADETADRAAIEAVVRNAITAATGADGQNLDAYARELTAERLRSTTYMCQLTTVSEIIREHQLDTIDLLKIDAEKSEVGILDGIDDADWPRIRQVVMEVHDPDGDVLSAISRRLEEKGYRCSIERDRSLDNSGLVNLYATRDLADGAADGALERTVTELCGALKSFVSTARTPVMVCLCPGNPEREPATKARLDRASETLRSGLQDLPGVRLVTADAVGRYLPSEYYDRHAYEAGHVPYTSSGFAAIGTAVFRSLYGLQAAPYKVIALDCDNTLWSGIVGEDGPAGIELTTHHRALQEFMVRQAAEGMLLVLCSKNNERDVIDVFAQRPDMPLTLTHFAAHRINWNSKSSNLQSLAQELNVGLDSFVLVDDNPVECAEVRRSCPSVLTLELPRNSTEIPRFLDHVWAFDRRGRTEEDRQRTQMYRANTERRQFEEASLSMKDFIDGLHLRIEISDASAAQMERVSQLTLRTNQFNFTTIRRSEADVREFLRQPGARCLAVRVSDRFGDYGVVGVVLCVPTPDHLRVDTFLLSCRVLGKGVEHAVMAEIGRLAAATGRSLVQFDYQQTPKNAPVAAFMARVAGSAQSPGSAWLLPADRLMATAFNPDDASTQHGQSTERDESSTPSMASRRLGSAAHVRILERVAADGPDALAQHMAPAPLTQETSAADQSGTVPTVQQALLQIWRQVLAHPGVSVDDNFFDAGGTSLKAVQVVAAIRREFGRQLSVVTLFECPTITQLAARLGDNDSEQPSDGRTGDAALRGQKRRVVRRRKAS